jgi:hypothetical protein
MVVAVGQKFLNAWLQAQQETEARVNKKIYSFYCHAFVL